MKDTVLENFLSLCAIPHKSGHEEALSRWLYRWALDRGLAAWRDEAGNVIIDKAASPGCENAPRAILQAHMDMVTVWEEGLDFDPLRDPVQTVREGNILRAQGTSLGADDGAGVALAMSILEDTDAVHGPLRAIFTVDEEVGMTGAGALESRYLDGKYLLNLDWEEFGSVCCSSAGSELFSFRFAPRWVPATGSAWCFSVRGLAGGHSGTMIHLGRGNALGLAARMVLAAGEAGIPVSLGALEGGVAHNAIPSAARAVLLAPEEDAGRLARLAEEVRARFLEEHAVTDPQAEITLERVSRPETALALEDTRALAECMCAAPVGVYTYSPVIPGLVESSANLGTVVFGPAEVGFDLFQRSSSAQATQAMRDAYQRLADHWGARLSSHNAMPHWPVRKDSRLLSLCLAAYSRLFGEEMAVKPVHAGLECGSFSSKAPQLDIVSIGPQVADIHSPRESLDLESVDRLHRLVLAVLEEIARE